MKKLLAILLFIVTITLNSAYATLLKPCEWGYCPPHGKIATYAVKLFDTQKEKVKYGKFVNLPYLEFYRKGINHMIEFGLYFDVNGRFAYELDIPPLIMHLQKQKEDGKWETIQTDIYKNGINYGTHIITKDKDGNPLDPQAKHRFLIENDSKYNMLIDLRYVMRYKQKWQDEFFQTHQFRI